jgi:hypothetical protein
MLLSIRSTDWAVTVAIIFVLQSTQGKFRVFELEMCRLDMNGISTVSSL